MAYEKEDPSEENEFVHFEEEELGGDPEEVIEEETEEELVITERPGSAMPAPAAPKPAAKKKAPAKKVAKKKPAPKAAKKKAKAAPKKKAAKKKPARKPAKRGRSADGFSGEEHCRPVFLTGAGASFSAGRLPIPSSGKAFRRDVHERREDRVASQGPGFSSGPSAFSGARRVCFLPAPPFLSPSIQRRFRACQFQSGTSSVKFPSGNFHFPSRNNFLAGSSLHR
jgi:hypothetical protein